MDILNQRTECYCAYCKNKRKVYKSKHLSFSALLGFMILSVMFSFVIWKKIDIRSLIILAVFLMIGELFSQIRWRQALICHNCGFDPIIYKQDPKAAALKIKEFLAERAEKPEFLLRPPVNMGQNSARTTMPNTMVESKANALVSKKGKNLSLQG